MYLITAIKSGKPFKRKSWEGGYYQAEHLAIQLRSEDILADDWEFEEPTIEITWSRLEEAIDTATTRQTILPPFATESYYPTTVLVQVDKEMLAKELFGKNAPLKGAGEK